MKSKLMAIFWAIVMIAAGVVFLLRETGVIQFDQLPRNVAMILFAVLSGFFFLTYFLEGVRSWGWLFPATIFAALTLIIVSAGTPLGDAITGAPIMIAIAIPFLVAFSLDPKKAWWALIPAWVMVCISLIILFEDRISGNVIGSFVLYSIALPFLVVFLLDRTRRWALIPFGILAVIGVVPLLEDLVSGEAMGLVMMLLFAIPFFVAYFWSKKNWWALIPAGVFSSIALVVLYTLIWPMQGSHVIEPIGTSLLLTGIGLTFGALWLRRATQPTDWAKVPALILFALAVLLLVFGEKNVGFFWPVALIIFGAVILVSGLIKKPAKPAAPIASSEKKIEKRKNKKQ